MPNWVKTCISFGGKNADIDAVFDEITTVEKDKDDEDEIEITYCDFNELIAAPKDFYGEQLSDWCMMNWGCERNAVNTERFPGNILIFETAWTFPEHVINALNSLCCKHNVDMIGEWASDEIARNCGYFESEAEDVMYIEHHLDYSNWAYETYVRCWGDCTCIFRDAWGTYHHYNDCDTCPFDC